MPGLYFNWATSYSPTHSRGQYHRGCRAYIPCSGWERVGPLRYNHPKVKITLEILNIDGQHLPSRAVSVYSTFYGQAERAISNGKLNVLLRFHIPPINVVVFDGPY